MAIRHALDQALVAHAFVDRLERVEAMLQGNFHLPRRVLRNRRARRQALGLAGGIQVIEEWLQLLQLVDAIDLGRPRPLAIHLQRRQRPAVAVAFAVEQVELQFHRHHRVETLRLQAVDNPLQHMPGIARRGR